MTNTATTIIDPSTLNQLILEEIERFKQEPGEASDPTEVFIAQLEGTNGYKVMLTSLTVPSAGENVEDYMPWIVQLAFTHGFNCGIAYMSLDNDRLVTALREVRKKVMLPMPVAAMIDAALGKTISEKGETIAMDNQEFQVDRQEPEKTKMVATRIGDIHHHPWKTKTEFITAHPEGDYISYLRGWEDANTHYESVVQDAAKAAEDRLARIAEELNHLGQ